MDIGKSIFACQFKLAWTYVISDVNGEEIVGTFYKKEFQKTNQKKLRV